MKFGKYIFLLVGLLSFSFSSISLYSYIHLFLWKEIKATIIDMNIKEEAYNSKFKGTIPVFFINGKYSYTIDGIIYTGNFSRNLNKIEIVVLQKTKEIKVSYNPDNNFQSGYYGTIPSIEIFLFITSILLISIFPVAIITERKKS